MVDCEDLIDIGVYRASLYREIIYKPVGVTVEYKIVERFKTLDGRGVGTHVRLLSRKHRRSVDDDDFKKEFYRLKRKIVEYIGDKL